MMLASYTSVIFQHKYSKMKAVRNKLVEENERVD